MEEKDINIKTTLKLIIEESTIHGIPRVFKAKYLITKITWIIFFCISASVCTYSIIASILNYFQYSVVTTIETITEIPSNFPVIAICNLNQLQTKNSLDLVQKYSAINYFSNILKNFFMMNELSSFNDTFKKSFIYSLNETLLSCTINTISCSSSDFVWSYNPIYGNCYSFNTGFNSSGNSIDLIQISKAGNLNGLKLELFIDNPNNIANFIQKSGYHVIIHNKTYKISLNDGYDISSGVETNLAVNKIYQTLKPKPHSDCIVLNTINSFDSYLYRAIYRLNQTYRQNDCFDLCYQQILIETCQCYTNTLDKLYGTMQCLNFTQLNCMTNIWNKFLSDDYISNFCIQYCPLECYSINYEIKTTFSNYPNYNYALNSLMTNPIITSNQISKDAKIEIVDLVSGIGGLLGLFLGMSFLSFAEIIEMFLEALSFFLQRSKNNKILNLAND